MNEEIIIPDEILQWANEPDNQWILYDIDLIAEQIDTKEKLNCLKSIYFFYKSKVFWDSNYE